MSARLKLAALLLAAPPLIAITQPAAAAKLSERAELGRQLFFDPALSASGQQACSSCHDPAHAYAPANDLAVQFGGADMKQPGTRAVPTLMYKNYTLAYSDHYQNPDNASPPGPGGGFGWDGRSDRLDLQPAIPLLAPNEMANASRASVAAKLRHAAYLPRFTVVFGKSTIASDDQLFEAAGAALLAFETEDASFHPYASKFDRYRNNKRGGELSDSERRGYALYLREDKGNCNACHLLGPGNRGSQDISSDYSFAALGVPRNAQIAVNADPAYFDLGLCGPLRKDHRPAKPGAANEYCGLFKTPVLRNVTTRKAFMHNGRFKSLRDVLRFYATRDTQPELWYPLDANGQAKKFDDLPPVYRDNLDHQPPLDQRPRGSAPALSDADIDDLLAFLGTLTDDRRR
jgi:cytochrome c peroxidase